MVGHMVILHLTLCLSVQGPCLTLDRPVATMAACMREGDAWRARAYSIYGCERKK